MRGGGGDNRLRSDSVEGDVFYTKKGKERDTRQIAYTFKGNQCTYK